ncbi:MAG: hypothetical protein KKD18_06935 [Nanoarchaeota archaeon]|nr:hypothetical protein [Nanoarchaeota archaeon]MBU0978127.1 hypothetical protein [Nanoarchaeota archaeon]
MADQAISKKHLQDLEKIYSPRQIEFILSELNETEMRIIDDTVGMLPEDYLYIAVANKLVRGKRTSAEYLSKRYHARNLRYFNWLQTNWLDEKNVLMGERLHRSPGGAELMKDAIEHDDALRFRVFFCLRYRTDNVLVERKIAA